MSIWWICGHTAHRREPRIFTFTFANPETPPLHIERNNLHTVKTLAQMKTLETITIAALVSAGLLWIAFRPTQGDKTPHRGISAPANITRYILPDSPATTGNPNQF
jgi:hypothetical protein